MEIKFEVRAKIQRPVEQVFDAVYNPNKLTRYFTTGSASGPLDEGTTVMWDFADHPGAFPVTVVRTVPNRQLVFEWGSATGGQNRVEITFERLSETETLVTIVEAGWTQGSREAATKASYQNCQGWMNMACCLKAYLEYDINLRKGFF